MAECLSLRMTMGQWYGNHTAFSDISLRVMGNLISGMMILLSALKLTVGWIGLKLAYNRLF
ncbi:hypothetical protein ABMA08_07720 [Pseudomonas yamanorum]